MNPPFTIEQFLSVFVAYNAAIWPAQIAAYVLGLLAVLFVWLNDLYGRRVILTILGIMWAWNGIGYHFLFFAEINPAARLFAGFFLLQGILFAAAAVAAKDIRFHLGHDFRSLAGSAFIIYAMTIYPILGILAGHGLMAGPMFGLAPCPTTIFTIGLLLLARGKWIVWLSVIPLLWSLVGLAAALQLAMLEDFGLPFAGFILLLVLGNHMITKRICLRSHSGFVMRHTGWRDHDRS